jgi:hypothetical protein
MSFGALTVPWGTENNSKTVGGLGHPTFKASKLYRDGTTVNKSHMRRRSIATPGGLKNEIATAAAQHRSQTSGKLFSAPRNHGKLFSDYELNNR